MNQEVTSDRLLLEVLTLVRQQLPPVNVACRDGVLPLSGWVEHVRPPLTGIESVASGLNPEGRLLLLQHLSFVLASGERHAQARGHAPGWIVQQLPGLQEALVSAASGDRVPALTSELYWEANSTHPPLSFTGEQ